MHRDGSGPAHPRRVRGIALILVMFLMVVADAALTASDGPEEPQLPSLEEIQALVQQRIDAASDMSFTFTFRQYDPQSQAVQLQWVAKVQAVRPSVVRLEFQEPDLYRGNVYALDYDEGRVYQYHFIFDTVECSQVDDFLKNSNMGAALETVMGLLTVPGDNGALGSVSVDRVETIDGVPHAVLVVTPSARVEAGIDALEETLPSLTAGAETLHVWVDLKLAMVRKAEVRDGDGKVLYSVETRDVMFNRGLVAAALKRFPGAGTRSCRF